MSTAIVPLGSVEILPPVHIPDADSLRAEVDGMLDAIRNQEFRLSASYVRFARLLLEVRSGHHWQAWGFRSWGAYMADIGKRIAKARSQMYNYIAVTEALTPLLEPEVLEEIGISKASELRRYVKGSLGQRIPVALLDAARDHSKGIEELRAEVYRALHQDPDPKGRYYDLGGVFATEEDIALFQMAERAACRVDPVIPQDTPEHLRRLEIFKRWAQEFLSSYPELADSQSNN